MLYCLFVAGVEAIGPFPSESAAEQFKEVFIPDGTTVLTREMTDPVAYARVALEDPSAGEEYRVMTSKPRRKA